ncbi:hypothetical protein B296_00059105 [Ensete ventricosum]|uniref:Uncharacterized protein n=1 Tax=Ensete ventricosum TaxID=4639 RepID=A0A426XJ56_ENSVE|nr:hypothetical protein B296_00059105 [Ensete ventricosum]
MNRTVLIGRATLWGHHCWSGVDVVEAFVFSSFSFLLFLYFILIVVVSVVVLVIFMRI